MRRKVLLWLAVALFAAGYFVLDVRQRARIDRGAKRHRTDFTVYQYAARALVHGQDPYAAVNPRGYRYVYPPLLAVLLQPVADWEPADAALLFYVVSLLFLLAAMLTLMRVPLLRGRPALGVLPVVVAGIVCLGFAHQGFQRGQVTHVLLGMQVLALVALSRGRPLRAGVWLGVAGALRLTPLLPAAGVGLGLLVHALRRREPGTALRYGGGLALGLLAGFVLVPVGWLGSARAAQVGDRWVEVTRAVYAQNVDLEESYRINEWRFKNQAPRRVYGTWAGWATGAPFVREEPQFEARGTLSAVDGAAAATTWLLLALALGLGVWRLQEPGAPGYAATYVALLLLPVLMTRYTWPTHYLMALPAVAWAAGRGWRAAPVLVLLGGTLSFYAAHCAPLQVVGEAGCLMLACVAFLVLVLRQARAESQA